MLKRIRTFLKLNPKTKLLFLEAYLQLGRARYLKSISFSKVAPSLGEEMRETSFSPVVSNNREIARIAKAIHVMSRHTLWESQCLVKAIAGMKMLEKRNIESTLYLGMAKDEKGKADCPCMVTEWCYLCLGCRSDGTVYGCCEVRQRTVRE